MVILSLDAENVSFVDCMIILICLGSMLLVDSFPDSSVVEAVFPVIAAWVVANSSVAVSDQVVALIPCFKAELVERFVRI